MRDVGGLEVQGEILKSMFLVYVRTWGLTIRGILKLQ